MQQYKFKISELDFEPVAILTEGSDEQKTLLALHTGKKTIAQLVATVNLAGGSNCLQKPYNIHRNRLKTLAFYY